MSCGFSPRLKACLFVCLCLCAARLAPADETISGDTFRSLMDAQWSGSLELAGECFPDSIGYSVLSSHTAEFMYPGCEVFARVTVICPDLTSFRAALRIVGHSQCPVELTALGTDTALSGLAPGFRGAMILARESSSESGAAIPAIQLHTVNQFRWLRWWQRTSRDMARKQKVAYDKYSSAVSDYLLELDTGFSAAVPPTAADYELPQRFDFYAPQPDYVIQGYDNYKDFLFGHNELKTGFASGIIAFVPTAATLESIREDTPQEAFPNKERAALQKEYRKFLDRGGDVRSLQRLTKCGFDTLAPGEYFFVVGLNHNIRIGRELPREEVKRLEEETGRKVPRANHAFLFYGEPVLSAGAFWISERGPKRIERVNAQSGHYFYSNLSASIREDISVHSDRYFKSLAWFFKTVHELDIPHDGILVSKM
ncbi:MAG: hypothetical protein ACE5GA_03365 [Candidatus Zixiibacteriota bacterium]